MRKTNSIPKPRRARTGGSQHTLTSGTSELLRSLGVILGNAYADDASADTLAALESAKNALIEARRTVHSND